MLTASSDSGAGTGAQGSPMSNVAFLDRRELLPLPLQNVAENTVGLSLPH